MFTRHFSVSYVSHLHWTCEEGRCWDKCCPLCPDHDLCCPPNWNNRRPVDKDREAEGKRLVVHHETLCLVALDKQRTYHVMVSFIICKGDMRAAFQVLILCQTNTDAWAWTENESFDWFYLILCKRLWRFRVVPTCSCEQTVWRSW